MYKIVEGRHGRGKVVLGRDATCPDTEYRGWGTGCETLRLKEDGFYHCDDCGLVYAKDLERYKKIEKVAPTIQRCECAVLEEVIEWWFDECHGYDCPSSRYCCTKCGRHYKPPPTAELDKQESEGGRKHVADWMRFLAQQHREKLDRIREDVEELLESLKEVSPEERQELLKPLF